MEKFGIFNLLSALADAAAERDGREEKKQQSSAPLPRQEAGVFSAEQRRGRAGELLERHAAISRRIDRSNGKPRPEK